MANGVKFIRKNGRIIPIRDNKSSSSSGQSKPKKQQRSKSSERALYDVSVDHHDYKSLVGKSTRNMTLGERFKSAASHGAVSGALGAAFFGLAAGRFGAKFGAVTLGALGALQGASEKTILDEGRFSKEYSKFKKKQRHGGTSV